MTEKQKEEIEVLRHQNKGYRKIAKELNIPYESVKAYCRRHNLRPTDMPGTGRCQQCGVTIEQTPGKKTKKFCSDACRNLWWNQHQTYSLCKEKNKKICEFCKGEFYSTKATARFCSTKCYADYRRQGGKTDGNTETLGAESETETNGIFQAPKPKANTERKELPALFPHCLCDECPWYRLGKRVADGYKLLADAVQALDCKPMDTEEKQ